MICAPTAEQEWLVRRGPGIGSHTGRRVRDGQLKVGLGEVTDGQLVTMSLVPGTLDSDVALECHLGCPPLYLQRWYPPWTATENSVSRD